MNPFIELWEHPVRSFAWLGYLLGLSALVIATVGVCWSNVHQLRARWNQERPQRWEHVPPLTFIARLAAIPLICMVDVWAIGAVVYLLA